MIKSYSAGGIVLNKHNNHIVLVKQNNGMYSLPKGHVEPGENTIDAARREIFEETGITDLKFIKPLGSYQRHTLNNSGNENTDELKTITIYLFHTFQTKFDPKDVDIPEWCALENCENKLSYLKDKEFFSSIKDQLYNIVAT